MSEGAAATAFDLLGDETRVRILQELSRSRGGTPVALSYSELMDRVGAENSGRFNYHLSKLQGHFVTKTTDGYRLSYEGVLIYRSIIAGTFSEHPPSKTISTESSCHLCAGMLVFEIEDHLISVRCEDCSTTFLTGYLPPRGYADRSHAELVDALDARIRYQMGLITRSVCPWCSGTSRGRLIDAAGTPLKDRPLEVVVQFECAHCEARAWMSVGQFVIAHPDIQIEADTNRHLWDIEFAVTDSRTQVVGRDPLRAAIDLPQDDETTVLVDEAATVARE